MKSNKLLFLCTLATGLLLAACAPQVPPEEEGFNPVPVNLVACDFQNGPEKMIAPCEGSASACSPQDEEVIQSVQPSFTWDNPYSCSFPAWDLVVVRDDPSYENPKQMIHYVVLDFGLLNYQLPFDLQPNTRYEWRMSPSEYMLGVFSTSTRHVSHFWTGPICETSDLEPPDVFYPQNYAVIHSPFELKLKVAHPGDCGAEAYEYELSESQALTAPLLEPFEHFYSTVPLLNGSGDDLDDCITYYWHIRGVNSDGAGPWTPIRSFFTNYAGDCPTIFDFFPPLYFEELVFPDWPYAIPIKNANCRLGDTLQHKNVATLFAGKFYELLAVNPQFSYVRVHEPSANVNCWVLLDLVVLGKGPMVLSAENLQDYLPISQPAQLTSTPTAALAPATPTPAPECRDGIDNDGDGDIDLADGRCTNANDNDEGS